VIVASYLLVLFIKLHHDEAHSQRGPRWELLMHYGYWAFLLLMIDFFLQVHTSSFIIIIISSSYFEHRHRPIV